MLYLLTVLASNHVEQRCRYSLSRYAESFRQYASNPLAKNRGRLEIIFGGIPYQKTLCILKGIIFKSFKKESGTSRDDF